MSSTKYPETRKEHLGLVACWLPRSKQGGLLQTGRHCVRGCACGRHAAEKKTKKFIRIHAVNRSVHRRNDCEMETQNLRCRVGNLGCVARNSVASEKKQRNRRARAKYFGGRLSTVVLRPCLRSTIVKRDEEVSSSPTETRVLNAHATKSGST